MPTKTCERCDNTGLERGKDANDVYSCRNGCPQEPIFDGYPDYETLIENLRAALHDKQGDMVPVEDVAQIKLEALETQRRKGWVDFHPEMFCHACGCRNIQSWFTSAEQWNKALGKEDQRILCPQCFIEAWTKANGDWVSWEVRPR